MTWLRSTFRLSRAWAAWLQLGRLHALNLVCTVLWLAYFDVSVETPFGVRSLPLSCVAPVVTVLVAAQPLCSRDSALVRQTAQRARGALAAIRLCAALTILAVGVGTLWLRGGALVIGLPLIVMALAILCVLAAGQVYWAPLCLAFMASLPWVLSDSGTTQVTQWSADGRVAVLGVGALGATGAAYLGVGLARWPLTKPIATE